MGACFGTEHAELGIEDDNVGTSTWSIHAKAAHVIDWDNVRKIAEGTPYASETRSPYAGLWPPLLEASGVTKDDIEGSNGLPGRLTWEAERDMREEFGPGVYTNRLMNLFKSISPLFVVLLGLEEDESMAPIYEMQDVRFRD